MAVKTAAVPFDWTLSLHLAVDLCRRDSKHKCYNLVPLDLHLKWLQLQSDTPYLFPNYMGAAVAWPAVSQQESPGDSLIVDAWSFLNLNKSTRFLTNYLFSSKIIVTPSELENQSVLFPHMSQFRKGL